MCVFKSTVLCHIVIILPSCSLPLVPCFLLSEFSRFFCFVFCIICPAVGSTINLPHRGPVPHACQLHAPCETIHGVLRDLLPDLVQGNAVPGQSEVQPSSGAGIYLMVVRIHCLACRSLCMPPWLWLPRPWLMHDQTCHAERCYKQLNILSGFCRQKKRSHSYKTRDGFW